MFRLRCYRIEHVADKPTSVPEWFTGYVCRTRSDSEERVAEFESGSAGEHSFRAEDIIIHAFRSRGLDSNDSFHVIFGVFTFILYDHTECSIWYIV